MKGISINQLYILTIVYIIGAFTNSYFVVEQSKEYNRLKVEYAEKLNWEDRLLNLSELIFDTEEKKRLRQARAILEDAEEHYDTAMNHIWYFLAFTAAYLLMAFVLFRGGAVFYKSGSIAITAVALVCLLMGIFIPVMELAFLKADLILPIEFTVPIIDYPVDIEKHYDGETYFFYQNKSIMGLVGFLMTNNNIVVGLAILLFSVLVPITKLVMSIAILLNPHSKGSERMEWIINKIGKWSMADVFVAGVLLAYLSLNSMNVGVEASTRALPGLYFFLAYCILSLISTHFINAAVKHERSAKA